MFTAFVRRTKTTFGPPARVTYRHHRKMASSNYIKNVAIVGASGNCGSFMTAELLKTGKHRVTAITRQDSPNQLPEGVIVAKVDYSKPSTIVTALKDQDALVITVGIGAARDTESILIDAAAEAGVPWVLPNEWCPDTAHAGLTTEVAGWQARIRAHERIRQLGRSSYIAVTTGFWYEWSIGIPAAFGIDLLKHEATLFDEGETKISTSTWPQVGRSVAGLLSLPIKAEGGDSARCLEHFRNKHAYVSSFVVSQKDMLASAFQVTGTKESDWKITKEPAKKRYQEGLEAMQKGDREGFARMMYTRVFYPDDSGNFDKTRGTVNELLGLPHEDIKDATRVGVERSKTPLW